MKHIVCCTVTLFLLSACKNHDLSPVAIDATPWTFQHIQFSISNIPVMKQVTNKSFYQGKNFLDTSSVTTKETFIWNIFKDSLHSHDYTSSMGYFLKNTNTEDSVFYSDVVYNGTFFVNNLTAVLRLGRLKYLNIHHNSVEKGDNYYNWTSNTVHDILVTDLPYTMNADTVIIQVSGKEFEKALQKIASNYVYSLFSASEQRSTTSHIVKVLPLADDVMMTIKFW